MFCAVSGSVPETPVVSVKSGHIFEKSVAEKYVRETGKCPVTGETLAVEDLLPVKSNKTVKPRTSQATSIPGLLGLFHDEWDALMLETHTVRQNLHTVRQELSHALYQHDAACRVIARLLRERDEARTALENIREQVKAEMATAAATKRTAEAEEQQDDGQPAKRVKKAGIPQEVLDELTEVNSSLSKGRKKRVISPTLATAEEIANITQLGSYPLHQTRRPGILSIDISPAADNIVATAGADTNVHVYDVSEQRVVASINGHSKRVNAVQFVDPSVLLTASVDKTAGIWRLGDDGQVQCGGLIKDHSGDVTGVTVHPSKHFFVTSSSDKSWCFCDLATATSLVQVADEQVGPCSTCPPAAGIAWWPAGALCRMWDSAAAEQMQLGPPHLTCLRHCHVPACKYLQRCGTACSVRPTCSHMQTTCCQLLSAPPPHHPSPPPRPCR
jgi:pre-mRNA-processing factor 19